MPAAARPLPGRAPRAERSLPPPPPPARVAMMPTYSMMGPFKGHMSLKSSPFSPGSSCKLSNQYIIQDHMAAHYRKLMSAKAAVDLSAPKSLHTSVKYNDQQKRDRLIQALENYKKDHVRSLSASPFTSRSVSPGQQKRSRSLLAKSHLYLQFGQNNCSLTKREQPPFVPFQKLPSRTLSPAFTARKTIQNPAQDVLSETHVHEANTGRLSASPLRPSHIRVSSCSRKKTFQNSFNKTYSGDLLDKHSVCFTEKKHFTPRILKRSHQSVLVKHRYYNPPHKKKNLSPGRPSLKSVDVDSEKKGDLRSFLEDALVRPQLNHFCEKPVENYELWFTDSDMSLSPRSQLQEKADYFCFLEDLTNDILIRRCYHKAALEDVFQTHIKSKRHNLDEVKMRRIVQSLKKELNITKQPDLPISCNSRQNDASIAATCF